MNVAIKNVLESLRAGNLQAAYDCKEYLNDVAISLYNKSSLNPGDLEDLKDIITICNITYNDTDKEILPIEDGVYDLLLEKHKTYEPNWQVGAEVLQFEASRKNGVHFDKPMQNAVTFEDPVSDKDYFFRDNIVVDSRAFIDRRDFENVATPIDESYISKRYHDTANAHPELIGTLDKCKFVLDRDAIERGVFDDSNVKTVERDFFGNHLNRGIINARDRFDMILELKYDGISVEADCTDEIVSARSRGDTGAGKAADLTPILKGYKFPHRTPGSKMIGVKFEAIMTLYDLPYFNAAKGYEYKNCRSAIVGLLSSADAWKYRDFITLVPLAVEREVYETVCEHDRMKEIEFLNKEFISKGCPLRHTMVTGTYIENLAWINLFTQNAEFLRSRVPFMYDGIVVSYRDENIRKKLGRENFVNKYSIAVKFNPLKKETIFRGYTFTVGQDGSITPMIHYDPVEFYGTIHPKSSGHSYARFQELKLHKGDVVSVEYMNDVMPYVSKPINDWNLDNEKVTPIEEFPKVCPICGYPIEISDSGKSARCYNPECGGRQLARMVNTCVKLGMNGFGEATIAKLGCYHLYQMGEILLDRNRILEKGFGPGECENMINEFTKVLDNPMFDSVLLGSIGFTGISTKTWELILPKLDYHKLKELLNMLDPSGIYKKRAAEFMASIKGIGPATADTIVREFKTFEKDIDWMYAHGNIMRYQKIQGKKVRFTGFRDKDFVDYLRRKGFDADDNAPVTKDTDILLVPHEGHSSNKTQVAFRYGITIVPVQEFRENISKYL